MIDDIAHDRQQVLRAVEDFLRTPLDSAAKIDVNGAASLITQFVFHGQVDHDDSTRYEWYYILLGKAITIAQAWKENFAANLKLPSETRGSLIEYIDNTYGAGSCGRSEITL
jgi:hypothetical protein